MSKKGKGTAQIEDIESKYNIVKEIGEGGNARVYEAQNVVTNQNVALKRLDHFDAEKESRFLNEIQVMTGNASSVPGVMPVYDYSKEHFWYSMPVAVPVMNEFNIVEKWPPVEIVKLFIALAETLEKLHSMSVCHRDIKPANIYLMNSRLCFGDFGLVDFPDADTLTHSDRALGSTFTIAPEMKRNPKNADGKAADVYSMAKTLWMFLTRDEKGFDGQYNEKDRQHRLNEYKHLHNVHLLEIEELLAQSTVTDPALRPTIKEFKEALEDWLIIFADEDLCQERDWLHLTSQLFDGRIPESVSYKKRIDIVDILNKISMSPAFNHMFIPSRGGLDLNRAELSAEKDCICMYANGCWFIVKPKALHFESFPDVKWNYFLLETFEQTPVLSNSTSEWEEDVVEDTSGHYVDGTDSCYGVYNYDSGEPLPAGWRFVSRTLKGSFLFVMKSGYYNMIQATYDARHTQCSTDEFRNLIEVYQQALIVGRESGWSDEKILSTNVFSVNPYGHFELPEFEKRLPSPKDFINNNYQSWHFSIPNVSLKTGAFEYYFVFEKDTGWRILFGEKILLIDANGKVIEKTKGDFQNVLTVKDRDQAFEIADSINNQIAQYCCGYDMGLTNLITIKWRRIRKPSHLFTRDELLKLYKEADDRRGNKLVIDEEGYAQMLPVDTVGKMYAVCHETFCARRNYVGKYSPLLTFEYDYMESLNAWLYHLERGVYVYCDSSLYPNEDEKTLIEKIQSFY